MAVIMQRVVPEPPGWVELASKLAATGKAQKVLQKKENRWKVIFADPAYRKMSVLWSLTAAFLQFGYYGVNNWLPTYIVNELKFNLTKRTGYLVGTYMAVILGKMIAGYLADIFGRGAIYAFGGLTAAVFLPVIVMYHSPGNIIILLTLFGFLYRVPYGVNATYMTESFETKIRGTAVGGAYNIGRIGAAIPPQS
jgi:AAHS family cis,cis-muconate transporter-like MFS transporter